MYKANKDFHKFFPEKKFNPFLDTVFSYLTGTHERDVCKCDDIPHEKRGYYGKRKQGKKNVRRQL
jgi:hypothetical protein